MTANTLVGRSSVQTWHCDAMGHMNVQFYVAYGADALAVLMTELGLGPRTLRERRQTFVAREQHMRFLKEMRPGTAFSIYAGFTAVDAHRLGVYLEFRHSLTGEPAAALTSALELTDIESPTALRPIPRLGIDRAQALRVEVPIHGRPRGLQATGATRRPPLAMAEAERLGLFTTYVGAVRGEQCDHSGYLEPHGVIARVAEAVPNLFAEGRADERGKDPRRGGAALEYRLAHHTRPRAGDTLVLKSGLQAVGDKTITWAHWMYDLESETIVATAEAVGIALDLVERKAMTMPAEERALLSRMIVPGLAV